jgi:hypothetical protein
MASLHEGTGVRSPHVAPGAGHLLHSHRLLAVDEHHHVALILVADDLRGAGRGEGGAKSPFWKKRTLPHVKQRTGIIIFYRISVYQLISVYQFNCSPGIQ